MNRDPAHAADIERRLANLAKAPRCGARTRVGHSCKQAAVTGRARCRMHGGARGSGGPRGDRNGNFKHGLWTVENVEMRKAVSLKIRETRALLQELKSARVDPAAQRKAGPASFSRTEPSSTRGPRTLCRAGLALGGSPHGMPLPRCEVHAGVQAAQATLAVRPDAWGCVAISDHPPLGLGRLGSSRALRQPTNFTGPPSQNEPSGKNSSGANNHAADSNASAGSRPSEYTAEIGAAICEQLAESKSLRVICDPSRDSTNGS